MTSRTIEEFIHLFKRMNIVDFNQESTMLCGAIECRIPNGNHGAIEIFYRLRIDVPHNYPNEVPRVFEIGTDIPRLAEYHLNFDGSLCLGSPLRILESIRQDESLVKYAKEFLLPYLYAVSLKQRGVCERMVYGELEHGEQGLFSDYKKCFGVQTNAQVLWVLKLLRKENLDYKNELCPCGCGRSLADCQFRNTIEYWKEVTAQCPREYLHLSSSYAPEHCRIVLCRMALHMRCLYMENTKEGKIATRL